ARHLWWRFKNFLRWQRRRDWRIWWSYSLAMAAGWMTALAKAATRPPEAPLAPVDADDGISVVIPSRNGSELLARLLPGLFRELEGFAHEVIVIDNGSEETWDHPRVRVERNRQALSFAAAVNRGIRLARYRYVCLLNKDMVLAPGFFAPRGEAFDHV